MNDSAANLKVRRVKISDLRPDPNNANQGTERGGYMLAASMEQTGAGRSIVIDGKGYVVAGNKTLEAAAELGIEDVLVVQSDGHTLVAVEREDFDLLAEEPDNMARRYAYFDNRASEVGMNWDVEQIIGDMESGVDLGDMFHDAELQALVNIAADVGNDEDYESGPNTDYMKKLNEKEGGWRNFSFGNMMVVLPAAIHNRMERYVDQPQHESRAAAIQEILEAGCDAIEIRDS